MQKSSRHVPHSAEMSNNVQLAILTVIGWQLNWCSPVELKYILHGFGDSPQTSLVQYAEQSTIISPCDQEVAWN